MSEALGVVDVHAHCVPQSLYERVSEADSTLGIVAIPTPDGPRWEFDGGAISGPVEELLVDVEARVSFMDRAGISVQFLSSFIDVGAHQMSDNRAETYARSFNDALAATVEDYPTRFRGLATLPLTTPEAAADELLRTVREHGFVGAEVPASGVLREDLEPLWRTAAEADAVLLIHPEAAATSPLPYFLGNFVGNPAETTVAAATLIMSGVLERHPDLRIILVHGGGFLPYQAGRLNHGFCQYGARFGAQLKSPPAEYIRRFYYDTILHDPDNLAHLVRTVGADRVVVGTDYPYPMGDADPHRTVGDLKFLFDNEIRMIKEDNVINMLNAIERTRSC
jgi:aminocarboxymuconate-semialdehyde decarboxylase